MRTRTRFGLVTIFTLLLGVGTLPAQESAPGKGRRAQEFLKAFERGDARATAGFFTPSGEYTDQLGHKHQGREALEKVYARLFAAHKGAKLHITVTSARMIAPEVALEEGISEVSLPGGGPPSVAAFSAVLVKQGGEWYFESVRESVARPPSNAAHFEGIDWLLGDWVGEATKGESARASYQWAENRNFIVSTFDTTLDGIPVIGGTQWIAWDAVDKTIRSWTFYSGGGVGEAAWTQQGRTWQTKIHAHNAEGKKLAATNTITPLDGDHFSWQITQLTVDGRALPDLPPVKMVRVKAEQK